MAPGWGRVIFSLICTSREHLLSYQDTWSRTMGLAIFYELSHIYTLLFLNYLKSRNDMFPRQHYMVNIRYGRQYLPILWKWIKKNKIKLKKLHSSSTTCLAHNITRVYLFSIGHFATLGGQSIYLCKISYHRLERDHLFCCKVKRMTHWPVLQFSIYFNVIKPVVIILFLCAPDKNI